jgi:hypothetical protein
MTKAEILQRKIELQFQYITLLGEEIDRARAKIKEYQDELSVLQDPVNRRCFICGGENDRHDFQCSHFAQAVEGVRVCDGFWPEGVRCNNFVEDPAICDDFGGSKGQCVCGRDKADHKESGK